MRVLVTGGRDFHNRRHVFQSLDAVDCQKKITTLVHGGATGADSLAHDWAVANQVVIEKYPVSKEEWRRIGKSASIKRNQKMAELGADLLVAFPGGVGTQDMVSRAITAKMFVCRTEDDPIYNQFWDIRFVEKTIADLDELDSKGLLGSKEAEDIRCLADESWNSLTEQQQNVFRHMRKLYAQKRESK